MLISLPGSPFHHPQRSAGQQQNWQGFRILQVGLGTFHEFLSLNLWFTLPHPLVCIIPDDICWWLALKKTHGKHTQHLLPYFQNHLMVKDFKPSTVLQYKRPGGFGGKSVICRKSTHSGLFFFTRVYSIWGSNWCSVHLGNTYAPWSWKNWATVCKKVCVDGMIFVAPLTLLFMCLPIFMFCVAKVSDLWDKNPRDKEK